MPRKKVEKVEEFKIPEITEEKKTLGQKVKKAAKVLLGVLLILGGLLEIIWFLPEFIIAFKGTIGTIVILFGIIVLALGWLD